MENLQLSATRQSELTSSGNFDIGQAIFSMTGLGTGSFVPNFVDYNSRGQRDLTLESSIDAPGQTVWAIQYRKIKLLTRAVDSISGSKSEWKIMLKPRGQTERTVVLMAELGDWDNQALTEDEYKWEEYAGEGDEEDVFIVPETEYSDEEKESHDPEEACCGHGKKRRMEVSGLAEDEDGASENDDDGPSAKKRRL